MTNTGSYKYVSCGRQVSTHVSSRHTVATLTNVAMNPSCCFTSNPLPNKPTRKRFVPATTCGVSAPPDAHASGRRRSRSLRSYSPRARRPSRFGCRVHRYDGPGDQGEDAGGNRGGLGPINVGPLPGVRRSRAESSSTDYGTGSGGCGADGGSGAASAAAAGAAFMRSS